MDSLVNEIVNEIKKGKVVALPTDTVYGLFSLPTIEGRDAINTLKGSPKEKQLSLMADNFEKYIDIIKISKYHKILIDETLPGKITYIVSTSDNIKNQDINPLGESVGIRVPSFEQEDTFFLRKVLANFNYLFATSANLSGEDVIDNYIDLRKTFPGILIKEEINKLSKKSTKIISLLNNQPKIIRK